MALAVNRHKKEVRTGLHMNFLFFLMSVVVLLVMGISMWKDTHPEWIAYQQQFTGIEHTILTARREELLRQIGNPDYVKEYQAALKDYQDKKAKFDAETAKLEGIEAALEEQEVRTNGGNGEEGGTDAVAPAAATPTAKPAAGGAAPNKASKGELDNLDAEFAGDGAAPAKPASGAKPAAPAQAKPAAKGSDKEMSDLDKEFADDSKSKPSAKPSPASASNKPQSASKGSANELSDLDKEFADDSKTKTPASSNAKATPAKGSDKELSDLDKEFGDTSTKAKPSATTTDSKSPQAAATPATQVGLTFDEADLKVDQAGAKARLEAAERDLLNEQRVHHREMIGLPEDDSVKRKVSDSHLEESKQVLAVAQADLILQDSAAVVKKAAQVCRWAQDVKTLTDLTSSNKLGSEPAEHVKKLQDSKASLDAHIEDLKRDLRLVEGQLSRNKASGPAVEQNYVDRLNAIDRCTTCHKAVEEAGFENASEPFKTHSPEILKYHPVERFGCVSCHGGWGNALKKGEAHGEIIGKGSPLLMREQVQSSCGKCHGETRQLSGEETYLAGAKLFKNSGCLGCHKVEPNKLATSAGTNIRFGNTAMPKAGPDLDRVNEKIQPAWLVGWLQNPQSHSLDARMPNLGLLKEQANAIATYLLTQKASPGITDNGHPSSLDQNRLAQGKKLVQNLGCQGCHVIQGEGMSVGPELTNIRTKVNAQWLYGWIANPKAYFPNSRMPVLNLTKDQCTLIGDYLLSVGSGKAAPQDFMPTLGDERAKTLGAKLIAERGCAGCHDIKGFDRISAPELTHVGDKTADVLEFGDAKMPKRDLYDYILTKIRNPRSFDTKQFHGKMPMFGLEEDDAKTIAIYLMSLSAQELPPEYTRDLIEQGSPLLAGRKIFDQHDCNACHRIAGQGGKIGPELTREGEMVRPGWLFEFLKQPSRIRWWADARMPNYHLTDQEATSLTEYFMALSNQPAPYEYTPPDQKVFPLAQLGAKYFNDLKCQSCHPVGGKQGVAGAVSKKLGPDLGLAPIRLKKEWLLMFLKDPQAFSPGTQMPTFGKPDAQYSAIIDYLLKQTGSK